MMIQARHRYSISGAVIMTAALVLVTAGVWGGAAPGPVAAQTIADSFAGFSKKNSNKPIDIEADSLEVLDDKKVAIFSGNVKARQGKFELISKKLKVTYSGGLGGNKKKDKTPGIKRIEATGKVAITTPDQQSATSNWANFDVLTRIVTIGGNVVLTQGGNVMRGDKLVIDLNTGRSKLHSKISAQKQGSNGKRPRISGVFLPGKGKSSSPFGQLAKDKSGKAKSATKSGSFEIKDSATAAPPLPWQKSQNYDGN